MFELGLLVLVLAGIGLSVGLAVALLGAICHLLAIPFVLLGWLLRGVLWLLVALPVLAALLVVGLLALPAALAVVLLPLALPALLVWLSFRLLRRRRAGAA